MRNLFVFFALAATLLAIPEISYAQSLTMDFGDEAVTGSFTSRLLQIIAIITIISLAPSILVMVTSFTRIIVVLSFLRSAMGLQQTPPNPVLISLALFLTAFIMTPTFQESYDTAIKPLINEDIDEVQAFERGIVPFRTFMLSHVREKDLILFFEIAGEPEIPSVEEVPLSILIPAFMISELRRAFEIGFLIFIPFLIIDMLVASTLMAMGMMMLPPVLISLPFKLVFFVLIDGWHMIAGSLVKSYGV